MTDIDISAIDSNFKSVPVGAVNFASYDIRTSPAEITGVFWDEAENCFARVPGDVMTASGNEGLPYLGRCTAGGQARFATDSKSISYTSMMCRWLNLEQLNMGFSGCGRGEPVKQAARG